MDHFGRDQLKELFEVTAGPAVSIYMSTHRKGPDVAAQPLRLRAALQQARELMDDGEPPRSDALLQPFEQLVGDEEFWRHQADGLALFSSDGFEKLYRLPASVPDLVVVAPTFHTRPLVEFLQAPERFWVLGLSQKDVRLWEGTVSGLSPVNLDTVPTSLREALGFQIEKDRLSMHSSGGHGNKPMFHGHGAGKDDTRSELEQFFRKVDSGIQVLLEDEIGPIILAAVDYYHPIYHGISKLENLAPEGIIGNVTDWDSARLHEAAWPIAKAGVDRKIDQAIQLWESSYGKGKVERDISAAARLAVAGRIRLLLSEKARRIWGHFDPATGDVQVLQEGGTDPGGNAVDLIDEIAERTLQLGGRALTLDAGRMPTDTGIAAVLR
ncbi:MAG: hypothetical protein P8049_02440 [Gemmatimonadota bacterium]